MTQGPEFPVAVSRRSAAALLRDFAQILDDLRAIGVVRTSNNPVADYAEYLVTRALHLDLAPPVATGFDARDPVTGATYQVKARRLTHTNRSRQLGFLRKIDAATPPFDHLVGVLFDHDFSVLRAAQVPFKTLIDAPLVSWVEYVGAWRVILRDGIWDLDGVIDLTTQLRAAANAPTIGRRV